MTAKHIGITVSYKSIADAIGTDEETVYNLIPEIDTVLDTVYGNIFTYGIFKLEGVESEDEFSLTIYDMQTNPMEIHEYAQFLRLSKEAFENSIEQIKLIFDKDSD